MTYIPYNHDKKKNNKNSNKNNTEIHYEPNKFFNAIVGGICLYLCGAFGWSIITTAYSDIKGAKEKVEQVQEVVEYVDSAKQSKQANQAKTGEYEFDIKNELELDAEDVKDILEKLSDFIKSGEVVSEDVVILDYSAVADSKSYQKQIIKKLSKYKDSVTFVIISSDLWSADDASAEYERVKNLASENIGLLDDTDFSRIRTNATLNSPQPGNLMLTLTYLNQ